MNRSLRVSLSLVSALGSAAECQAVLDLLPIKGHGTARGLQLLAQIGAMLTRMLH